MHMHLTEVNTSPKFLKIYTGYLSVALMVCKCVHGFMVSLQPISATSAYSLLPPPVVSICDLYWFCVPRLQLDNEVSQLTDHPHGTVCHQHYGHWTCRRAPSSRTEDAPVLDRPSPLRRLLDSGAGYKYRDLFT